MSISGSIADETTEQLFRSREAKGLIWSVSARPLLRLRLYGGPDIPPAYLMKLPLILPILMFMVINTMALQPLIIDRHGGSLSVESEVGRGTTFRISLPAPAASAAS